MCTRLAAWMSLPFFAKAFVTANVPTTCVAYISTIQLFRHTMFVILSGSSFCCHSDQLHQKGSKNLRTQHLNWVRTIWSKGFCSTVADNVNCWFLTRSDQPEASFLVANALVRFEMHRFWPDYSLVNFAFFGVRFKRTSLKNWPLDILSNVDGIQLSMVYFEVLFMPDKIEL